MRATDRFKENREITYLPKDIGEVMTESDCAKAWDYLESTLHISKIWRQDFEKKFLTQPRTISKQEFFIRYTRQNIDPHLSILLQRKQSPIESLLRFLLRDRLSEKKREGNANRNYYYPNHPYGK
jgi:hypothetical protein